MVQHTENKHNTAYKQNKGQKLSIDAEKVMTKFIPS
jgi:hypothetical protein